MRPRWSTIWLKTGLVPAFCAALLPVVVALFHLMPAMAYAPAPHPAATHHAAAHHSHEHHGEADAESAVAAMEPAAAVEEDCHPPGEPCDDPPSHRMGPHCPLCLWLQGLHVLPAPVAPALRLPSTRAVIVERYEAPTVRSFAQSSSQPRAPPISPAV